MRPVVIAMLPKICLPNSSDIDLHAIITLFSGHDILNTSVHQFLISYFDGKLIGLGRSCGLQSKPIYVAFAGLTRNNNVLITIMLSPTQSLKSCTDRHLSQMQQPPPHTYPNKIELYSIKGVYMARVPNCRINFRLLVISGSLWVVFHQLGFSGQ